MKYQADTCSFDKWDLRELAQTGQTITSYAELHSFPPMYPVSPREHTYFVSANQLVDTLGHTLPKPHNQLLHQLYELSSKLDRANLDQPKNSAWGYETRHIRKRNGGVRLLTIPCEELKAVQKQLLGCEPLWPDLSPHAVAYHKGATLKRATACHVGQSIILKMDIRHFFDCITFETVRSKAFDSHLCSKSVSTLLANLCCYKGRLPQGAPTSPAVSNQIMREFDFEVGRYCDMRQISYTRYCDDLTFSGDFDPAPVIDFVERHLNRNGFRVNPAKTQVLRQNRRQIVTGVVVNEKQQATAVYRRKIRQEMWYCERFGVRSHLARTEQDKRFDDSHPTNASMERAYLSNLLGRVSFVLSLDPENEEMLRYRAWLATKLCDADNNFLCW